MISEIKQDLRSVVPDAIVCSVGGGGLLAGVMRGCELEDWGNGQYGS
jgi:L-serine/L-threonine ammonia-lyase